MSKKATEFQRKAMSWMYRGKEIFKPLNTGWIDENVACVREWVANIFFYRKGDTTIMVDAGYNYDRLAEKMGWLGIDPKSMPSASTALMEPVKRPTRLPGIRRTSWPLILKKSLTDSWICFLQSRWAADRLFF